MATTISKKNKELTLLQAIERVVELAEDSKMSKEFMKKAKTEIQLLAKSYGITERQAVLFCVCMEKGPRRVDYDDLASYLDLNKIGVLSYASDIDALVRRRLLRYRDVKDEDDFDIPTIVIRCLKHNEVCAQGWTVTSCLNCWICGLRIWMTMLSRPRNCARNWKRSSLTIRRLALFVI